MNESLPAMVGNGQTHIARLEPVARAYMERLLREDSKPLPQLSIAAARQSMLDSQHASFDHPAIEVETRSVAGLRTRLVRPSNATGPLPAILYLHGGGWALGSPETHARFVRLLALGARATVVVPDYALAPEHPYPAALDQCYALAQHIQQGTLGPLVDPSRIAVAGDSAGGNLAAALSLRAAGRGDVNLRLQALVCPVMQMNPLTGSYREFANGLNLTAETMQWFCKQYAPDESTWDHHEISPLLANRDLLARVAPACIVTAGCDVLRNEGELFGARLIEAGNDATVVRCAATIHNFPIIDDLAGSGPAITATAAICEVLRRALDVSPSS